MKKNKGFTLIELLAIIVILAIIAVITVPIILNIIDNSKRGAVKDSAYGYKDAVNKYYVSKLAQDKNYTIPNDTYSIADLKLEGVTVSGQEPNDDSWVTIENNNITSGCLQFDEYKVDITNGILSEATEGTCESSFIYSTTTITNASNGTTTRPNTYVYFRYPTVNDEIVEGAQPQLCIYRYTFGRELCLKAGEYEKSKQKILKEYGYDASTWDEVDTNLWRDPEDKISCEISPISLYCADDGYDGMYAEAALNGSIEMNQSIGTYRTCSINVDVSGTTTTCY